MAVRFRLNTASAITLLAAVGLLVGCQEDVSLLHAGQAKSRYDLVGGPVAYADVGDFVLENDKVRIAILGPERSWGPGVYGGSLVDADLRRTDARYPSGNGRDRFAEIFPFANLIVPAPLDTQVTVLKDGSDGKEATIRVDGKGMFLFEGLAVLRNNRTLLGQIGYKNARTDVHFRTDYSLRPGDRHVTMKTWVVLDSPPDPDFVGSEASCGVAKTAADGTNPACHKSHKDLICKAPATGLVGTCECAPLTCTPTCPLAQGMDEHGCATCECSQSLPMSLADGSESVFGVILGDNQDLDPTAKLRAGVGAGDFVFFGNQNDIFVPGHGYDEEKPIWDGLFEGRDLFAKPLAFDFVGAAGGDVSYGYFTKGAAGQPDPKVMVPVFTSAATAFISAKLACNWDAPADDPCRTSRVYEFERYLAIGDGDIGSIQDEVLAVRGTARGHVQGMVRWAESGAAAHNSTVFVLRDPKPGTAWTVDSLIAANRAIDGSPGVLNAIDADVGLDLQEDGDFHADLVPGDYALVAMDVNKIVAGVPLAIHVTAGAKVIASPALPTPARLNISATDSGGSGLPAKATVVKLDGPNGKPLWRDGGRRPYFGQGRLGVGVQVVSMAMDGRFDIPVEAGDYQVVVSHGVEFGRHDAMISLKDGDVRTINALLPREIDSAGWVSGDFHLHAEPSFDSGMPLGKRVQTIAAEGVDYVASTDHDVLSDYTPFIRQLGLDLWLKAVVGSEVSTLEIGHYIGFPLQYHHLDVPSHGSVDWYCKPSNAIVDDIVSRSGFDSTGDKPSTIVAHPRDGFLGWLSQPGVNPYSLTRFAGQLEENNPMLRTMACDFDAFEVFNGKRFDLVHTATIREVMTYSRCLVRIDAAKDAASLAAACPELAERNLADLAKCPTGEDFPTCQHRYRIGLARVISADILRRTPAEAKAWLDEPTSADPVTASDMQDQLGIAGLCKFDASKLDVPLDTLYTATDLDRPCGDRFGMIEDEFRFLEHGFVRTMVGGSDSHGSGIEPGTPRTFVRASQDQPGSLDPAELAKNMRAGQAVATYGPFLQVEINGKGPGETTAAVKGGKVNVHVRAQTASWYGIDRIEIYVNGVLAHGEDLIVAATTIVDLDKTYTLDVPNRDSWVIVKVIGTNDDHLMRPVTLDVPFGELQLPRVASIAFGNVPVVNSKFPPPVKVPDFYPVYPLAIANPVLLDTDGNGKYDAPLPYPAFCSPPCDPATGKLTGDTTKTCADLQSTSSTDADKQRKANYKCLSPENRCGLDIPGLCDIYQAKQNGALRGALGTH